MYFITLIFKLQEHPFALLYFYKEAEYLCMTTLAAWLVEMVIGVCVIINDILR